MKAADGPSFVLWNFARLMRGPPRMVEPDELARDTPPERFVEKIADEGGDVYVAPVLEALRATLRAKRAGATADASCDAPEAATPAARTEAPP